MSTTQFDSGTPNVRPDSPQAPAAPPPVVQGDPVELADGVYVIQTAVLISSRMSALSSAVKPRWSSIPVWVLATGPTCWSRPSASPAIASSTSRLRTSIRSMGSAPRRFKGTATIVYNRAQWDELRRKGGGYIELFKQLVPGIA